MGGRIKIVTILMGLMMLLSSCSMVEGGNPTLFQVGKRSFDRDECEILIGAETSCLQEEYGEDCWSMTINGLPFASYASVAIQDSVTELLTYTAMAEEAGMTLSETETQEVKRMAELFIQTTSREVDEQQQKLIVATMRDLFLSMKYQYEISFSASSSGTESLESKYDKFVHSHDIDWKQEVWVTMDLSSLSDEAGKNVLVTCAERWKS